MTLGEGPLRTGELTRRLTEYAPRTIYRHVARLVDLGLVERREGEGEPSAVSYRLTQPCGETLFALIQRRAGPSDGTRDGRGDVGRTDLVLLGELWDSGWFVQLSRRPRTSTELAEATDRMTFHQASRRIQLLKAGAMLGECRGDRSGKRYELTDHALRGMALMLELSRWRQRFLLPADAVGVTVEEVIATLAVWVPRVAVPRQEGKAVKLGVVGMLGAIGESGSEILTSRISAPGEIHGSSGRAEQVSGWALGTTNAWLSALLNGRPGHLRLGGEADLVESCLEQIHRALQPGSKSSPLQKEP
jgi:DNA-binding transcriptional ArsR family regulator